MRLQKCTKTGMQAYLDLATWTTDLIWVWGIEGKVCTTRVRMLSSVAVAGSEVRNNEVYKAEA